MFKYLSVSLLTIAFLFGFLLQAGAFTVQRMNDPDPNTAYPQIPDSADQFFDTTDQAAVYNAKLESYLKNTIDTTSILGFWQQ